MPNKAALLTLMDRVAEADSLPAVYQCALSCLQDTLGVERASVLVFDATGVMRFVAWNSLSETYRAAVDGHSPWQFGETEARPVLVEDVTKDPALAALLPVFEREDIRALAFVPIRFGSKLLGKFMLYFSEPHRVSVDELTVAQTIAGHVAFALEHHRIAAELEEQLDAEQSARRLADHQSALRAAQERRLQVLIAISDELAFALSPEDALTRLAQLAVGHLADYCVTYAVDGDAIRRLGLAHRVPDKLPLVEALASVGTPRLQDSTGAGRVIRTGEDLLVKAVTTDVIDEGTFDGRHRALVRKLEPLSAIVVGLRARGDTLGAIALVTSRDSGRRYCESDLLLAQEIARRAALLIDNSRLLARAHSANRARDDMIAVISHDLRTPMQTIATAAEVLQAAPPPDLASRSLEAIGVAASQVDRLLQDLLDVSMIDSGRLSLNHEIIDPATLITEAHRLFEPIASKHGVGLTCEIPAGLPPIRVDRARILQALSNVLGNAMKFVPARGRVSLSASVDGSTLRIVVEDNGEGIDPEHLPRIFDWFWRRPSSSQHGLGLGLAVTKGIVEAHGGEISVESHGSRGTSFAIVLETATRDAGTPAVPPVPAVRG